MKKQFVMIAIMSVCTMGFSLAQQEQMNHKEHGNMKMNMDTESTDGAIKHFEVSEQFQAQLKALAEGNQTLDEAFLHDDAEAIQQAIKAFDGQLSNVDMSLLTGESHHAWMAYMSKIKASVSAIDGSSDMAAQRLALATLNENLYKSLKAFGTGGATVYYNYCPMANGSGAHWLSTSSEIGNPFMGQKMPTCGSNKEILN